MRMPCNKYSPSSLIRDKRRRRGHSSSYESCDYHSGGDGGGGNVRFHFPTWSCVVATAPRP